MPLNSSPKPKYITRYLETNEGQSVNYHVCGITAILFKQMAIAYSTLYNTN
jgi:hypothetical protein